MFTATPVTRFNDSHRLQSTISALLNVYFKEMFHVKITVKTNPNNCLLEDHHKKHQLDYS